MGQRITILLVVFLLMLSGNNFAQQKSMPITLATTSIKKYYPIKIMSIAPDFYNKSLGFVCKKEFLLEKKTNIPFRFRLGSLDYVNRLEGKKL